MENKSENLDSNEGLASSYQGEENSKSLSISQKNLTDKFQVLEAELTTLKENIRKCRRENTSLKFLLYTGFALLLIGFIYSNTAIQKVQLQSLEKNVKIFQDQIKRDMLSIQKNLLQQSRGLVKKELAIQKAAAIKLKMGSRTDSRETIIKSLLENVNQTVFLLVKNRPELQIKSEEIEKQTGQLLKALKKSDPTASKPSPEPPIIIP